MSRSRKRVELLGLACLAIAAIALVWWNLPPTVPTVVPAAASGHRVRETATAVGASGHDTLDVRREQWRNKLDAIVRAQRARLALPDSEGPTTATNTCDAGCAGTLSLQLRVAQATADCTQLLPADAQGVAHFAASVLAEPGHGAVVRSVRSVQRSSPTLQAPAFIDCITESALLANLADPGIDVAQTFAFRYTAGQRGDNAAEFLADYPELIETYPELAAQLDRPPGAPPSSEDATTFARIISDDPEATAAFVQWSTERGVDISVVRTP